MNALQDNDTARYYGNDTATFGDRVTAAREAEGLSQADLANRLGVKFDTVAGWENDLSEPRANRVQTMAGVLNVSIMWLLTGEGDGLDGAPEEDRLSDSLNEILADMRRLKSDNARLNNRLGQIEKRLRTALRNA